MREGGEGRGGIVLYIPSGEGGRGGREKAERCCFINIIIYF